MALLSDEECIHYVPLAPIVPRAPAEGTKVLEEAANIYRGPRNAVFRLLGCSAVTKCI